MNLPLFILCFVFIITLSVLVFYIVDYIGDGWRLIASNGLRCYSDWICGGTINDLSQAESPVLDFIPMIYACRIDNFVPQDFSGIPGSNPDCVCPIQYINDYHLDKTVGSVKLGQLIPTDPANIKATYYSCDNSANANPSLISANSSNTEGTVGTCPATICQSFWASKPSVFTTTGTDPKMIDVADFPQANTLWPVKGFTGSVKNGRPSTLIPPGFPQLNPPGPASIITSMPTYKSSIILKQLI